jgi:hypothetical protein
MGELKRLPTTMQEFQDRYMQNNTVENEGTASEIRHMPCMFCGAPDVILLHALRVQEDLERGGTCPDCGRGIRVVFSADTRTTDGVNYEVFQTVGDEPPDYIVTKPRRVA